MAQNIIPNLQNACSVLRLLGEQSSGATQSELQEILGMPRATIFRILTTLRLEGFARKEGTKYFLGYAMAQFAIKSLSSFSLKDIAKPVLERLANTVGETAHLAVPSGAHSLIIDVADSPNPILVSSREGALAEIYCSSTGKIFLAHTSSESLDRILEGLELKARTSNTHTSLESLKKDLALIRDQGYAIDEEEYFEEVRCLAAPIHDSSQEVIAAIGITGTKSRFSKDRTDEVSDIVMAAAREVEISLN